MDAWLAIGSNLGDREEWLRAAVDRLDETPGLRVVAASQIFETPPFGNLNQGAFLNAALRIATTLAPETLLRAVKTIEARLGRRARERWGPREIDIDILYLGHERYCSPSLTIPHPGIAARAFVLFPLADLEPTRQLGPDPRRAGDLLAALPATERSGIAPAASAAPLRPRTGTWQEIELHGPEATHRLGELVGAALPPGATLALTGPLGAGKTSFVRGLARGLRLHAAVSSPTYTLSNLYQEAGHAPLEHWDFYRLGSAAEAEDAGFGDEEAAGGGPDTAGDSSERVRTVVEWADKFPELFPAAPVRVDLQHTDDGAARSAALRWPVNSGEPPVIPGELWS